MELSYISNLKFRFQAIYCDVSYHQTALTLRWVWFALSLPADTQSKSIHAIYKTALKHRGKKPQLARDKNWFKGKL